MNELRKNILTGEWVAIADERAQRPIMNKETATGDADCPFCKGNEHMIPQEFLKSGDGRVKVIENKYPTVTIFSEKGYGAHDVVIDTDLHDEKLHEFSVQNIETILKIVKQRILQHSANEKIKYVQVFKNQGLKAGASQPHSHWQIVALPFIPLMQNNIYFNSLSFFNETGKCFICRELETIDELVFYQNEFFMAYCIHSSKAPYEIHIAPVHHISKYERLEDCQLNKLAEVLKLCLQALNRIYPEISYNICFMNSFVNSQEIEKQDNCMHFFIEIIPRNGQFAGFELATLSYINTVPPETAAVKLKTILKEILV